VGQLGKPLQISPRVRRLFSLGYPQLSVIAPLPAPERFQGFAGEWVGRNDEDAITARIGTVDNLDIAPGGGLAGLQARIALPTKHRSRLLQYVYYFHLRHTMIVNVR
jgi:hypothetical protein